VECPNGPRLPGAADLGRAWIHEEPASWLRPGLPPRSRRHSAESSAGPKRPRSRTVTSPHMASSRPPGRRVNAAQAPDPPHEKPARTGFSSAWAPPTKVPRAKRRKDPWLHPHPLPKNSPNLTTRRPSPGVRGWSRGIPPVRNLEWGLATGCSSHPMAGPFVGGESFVGGEYHHPAPNADIHRGRRRRRRRKYGQTGSCSTC